MRATSDDTKTASRDHTENGTYRAIDLVPEAARDLTLEQLLALLVAKIVSHPGEVEVTVLHANRVKVIEFDVHRDDCGQLLGREGFTIRALRTIAKAILGPRTKQFSYHVEVNAPPR